MSSFILTGCFQNTQPPVAIVPTPQENASGTTVTNSGTTDTNSGKITPEETQEIEKEISIETKNTQSGSTEATQAIDDSLKAIDSIIGN